MLKRDICCKKPGDRSKNLFDSISHVHHEIKKDFYGFYWNSKASGGEGNVKRFNFLKISVFNHGDMKSLIYKIRQYYNLVTKDKRYKDLSHDAIQRLDQWRSVRSQSNCDSNLYESGIHPIIKFIHDSDIDPTGWVSCNPTPKDGIQTGLFTTCEKEITCEYGSKKYGIQKLDKNDLSSYKIASFDIECDSSHGDFPMPKKNYKKLSADIFDSYQKIIKGLPESKRISFNDNINSHLKKLMKSSFTGDFSVMNSSFKRHSMNKIYTNDLPSESLYDSIISLITDEIKGHLINLDLKGKGRDQCINSLQELIGSECEKEDIKVYGDPIIQIGTVFYEYGTGNIFRHILVIGPEDNMEDDKICSTLEDYNITVERCKTEKDLLLGWQKIIKTQDPDFITGYNIFGFDFKYIAERVDVFFECPQYQSGKCMCNDWGHHETCPKSTFYNLGKIDQGIRTHRNKICSFKTQDLNSSALGENKLNYFTMDGRILFDIQKEVQKGHSLDSYKLDNVASHFMRGKLKQIENDRIKVDSIGHLKKGDFVSFRLHSNIGEELYNDGKKIKINDIQDKELFLEESLTVKFDDYHKIEWCLNKDDISPQDIFDKQKDMGPLGSKGRAQVAKYCIQDCELCINLLLLLDIIPNNLAMANVSLVPASYIFLRGQGVRVTSVVAKTCSKRNTFIPELIKIPNLNEYVRMAKNIEEKEDTDIKKEYDIILKDIKKDKKYIIEHDRKGSKIYDIHEKYIRSKYVEDSDWRTPSIWELDNVLKQIKKKDEYKIQGFEGAIVLDPTPGIYLDDPITVLDYASLYPSSIIELNISHETFIDDDSLIEDMGWIKDKDYKEVTYDNWIYKGKGTGDSVVKLLDEENPKITCKFLTKDFMKEKKLLKDDEEPMGIIPTVLSHLLSARKQTKKRMKNEPDEFKKKVLDGLQLAYKVTANSVYGQLGAKTSPIFKLELAACTTSVGRERLTVDATDGVKKWALATGHEVPEVVYGDTDSVFVKFSRKTKDGILLEGKEALAHSIKCGQESGEFIKELMDSEGKQPQVLEYEKTFWPFILISKKRYTGDKYEFEPENAKRTSMGIVLKRRDNAPIVKYVFGHVIEKIMIEKDFLATVEWLKKTLEEIRNGEFPISYFVISKSLRGYYKNPQSIAHKVLADRMAERDPGNKPKSNDRIPYIYFKVDDAPEISGYKMKTVKKENGFYKNGKPKFKNCRVPDMDNPKYKKKVILQGDRIEHIDYMKDHDIPIDYEFYITNQIMNPVKQVLDLEMDPKETEKLFQK